MGFFVLLQFIVTVLVLQIKKLEKKINTTKEEPYDIENLFQIEEVIDIVQIKCNTYYKKQS